MYEQDAKKHPKYIENYLKTGLKNIINKGRPLVAKHRNSSPVNIFLSVTEFKEEKKQYFIGSCRDISELVLICEDLDKLSQVNCEIKNILKRIENAINEMESMNDRN